MKVMEPTAALGLIYTATMQGFIEKGFKSAQEYIECLQDSKANNTEKSYLNKLDKKLTTLKKGILLQNLEQLCLLFHQH